MLAAYHLSFKEIQESGRSYNEPNRTRKISNQLEAPDKTPPIRFYFGFDFSCGLRAQSTLVNDKKRFRCKNVWL